MNPDSKRSILNLFKGSGAKASPSAGTPNPRSKRLAVVLTGGVVLLLVFWAGFAIISRGGNKLENSIVKVAQRQEELIRLSDLGTKNAQSTDTAALATNTSLSVRTSQAGVNQILGRLERTLTTAERKSLQDKEVDDRLEQARRAGNFDEVFTGVLRDNLRAYQRELEDAYDASGSEENKLLLQQAYESTGILLGN